MTDGYNFHWYVIPYYTEHFLGGKSVDPSTEAQNWDHLTQSGVCDSTRYECVHPFANNLAFPVLQLNLIGKNHEEIHVMRIFCQVKSMGTKGSYKVIEKSISKKSVIIQQ